LNTTRKALKAQSTSKDTLRPKEFQGDKASSMSSKFLTLSQIPFHSKIQVICPKCPPQSRTNWLESTTWRSQTLTALENAINKVHLQSINETPVSANVYWQCRVPLRCNRWECTISLQARLKNRCFRMISENRRAITCH